MFWFILRADLCELACAWTLPVVKDVGIQWFLKRRKFLNPLQIRRPVTTGTIYTVPNPYSEKMFNP